jgi:hypothetical protein
MIDTRIPLRTSHGAEDEMPHAGSLGRIGHIFALLHLTSHAHRPKILDATHAIRIARGATCGNK